MSEGEDVPIRKIIHEIRRDDEAEEIKRTRDIAILENLQLQKELLKVDFPDSVETIDNVETGIEYDLIKEKLESERKQKRKHTGQAKMEQTGGTGDSVFEAKDEQTLIKNLYDESEKLMFLRSMGKPFDEQRLKMLDSMRDKVLKSLLDGRKSHGLEGSRWSVWRCFKCGNDCINTNVCPKCGYRNQSKTTIRGTINYV